MKPIKSKEKLHIPSSWSTTASAAFSFSLTVAAVIFWQRLREVHGSQHPPWRHWAFYLSDAHPFCQPGGWSSPSFLPGCLQGRGMCSQLLQGAGSLQLGPGTAAGGSGMDRKQLSKGIVVFEAFMPSDAERHEAEVPSSPPKVSGSRMEQVSWCRNRLHWRSPPWHQYLAPKSLWQPARHEPGCVTPMLLGTNPAPKPQRQRKSQGEAELFFWP